MNNNQITEYEAPAIVEVETLLGLLIPCGSGCQVEVGTDNP